MPAVVTPAPTTAGTIGGPEGEVLGLSRVGRGLPFVEERYEVPWRCKSFRQNSEAPVTIWGGGRVGVQHDPWRPGPLDETRCYESESTSSFLGY